MSKKTGTLSLQQVGGMLAALAVTYYVAVNHATLTRWFQKTPASK
jgi:hypothetical protein